MAAKRTSNMELNHDNWNDDMPFEEAGTFKCADKDELGRRVLKKAKRRSGVDSESPASTSTSKVFEGLKGMSSFATGGMSGKPIFNFGMQVSNEQSKPVLVANGVKNGDSLDDGSTKNATTASALTRIEASGLVPATSAKVLRLESSTPTSTPSSSATSSNSRIGGDRTEYYRQLRSLNESVLAWIKQHVDKNAYCILSPIFIDYDRHVKELDARYGVRTAKTSETSTTVVGPVAATVVDAESKFSSGAAMKINWPTLAVKSTPSTFDRTLGSVETKGSETNIQNEEETYEPPTNEVQEVKEDDAFYSIRCKLFYKKGSTFVEKGVGTLHLKTTAKDRTQLVIRAETNLGNILLNILLTTNLPTARMGKNNVSLICVPNPPLDLTSKDKSDDGSTASSAEPVTFLVRVKSADDADGLLQKLNESKS